MLIPRTRKFLRHRDKGTIFNFNETMLAEANVEEVTAEEAFPEKFQPKKTRGRKARINLDTEIEEVDKTPPGLAVDAAKGLSKK